MFERTFLVSFVLVFAGAVAADTSSVPAYDRDYFGDWSDKDGNCINTRHELLGTLSTRQVYFSEDGCRVVRGRWIDPYTGQIFLDASDLDIDHLVPLLWAWQRGAWTWSPNKLEEFANDPRNLQAVDDATNRSKGSKSPLEWLPPDSSYHCQYVLRFLRIILLYEIVVPIGEMFELESLKIQVCS